MAADGRARSRRASFGALAALVGCVACSATAPTASASSPVVAEGLARYLPLEDGTVAAYETTMQPGGERGLLVLEIRRPTPTVAELVVAGRARRLTVSEQAVAHVAGGFLLRGGRSASITITPAP